MKLALYVYDLGFNDLSDGVSDTLRVHFQNSISEVQTVAPELRLNGTPQSDNQTLFQALTSDDQESLLLLGAVSGNFVKARLTYQYMPELQELAADTINQFR